MKFRNLGFNKNNVVVLKYDQTTDGDYIPFKESLLRNPHVLSIAGTEAVPGQALSVGPFRFKDRAAVNNLQFNFSSVDPDYIPVMGMKLLAGRNFSWSDKSDMGNAFILNDAAVKKIGWTPQDAIGQPFAYMSDSLKGQVIGVVRDFNFQPLRYRVQPLVLTRGNDVRMLAVKISSTDIAGTMKYIRKTWKAMFPDSPINYSFLDKSLDALYKSEEKSSALFSLFSALSIAIASLGLYGLALHTAERRTKEIGVRKVLGASVGEVAFSLSKEFVKWVVIANFIAWPVAYYVMNNWLKDFAYRVSMTPWTFLVSGALALAIAVLTVGFRAVKGATANPVEALRYE
ncbi:MAG: hypothetical protein M1470_06720 [Bacteroidetes bacterium]|nr:hypothetical protein [Bacteroidota bacterium]